MMRWRSLPPRRRWRIVAAAILAIGLSSSAIIYATAGSPPGDPLDYGLDTSKQYVREIDVYGGTANLLATELREWFDSLWQGRRLAFTIVTLSVFAFLFLFFVSSRMPDRTGPTRLPGA